jgi:hypothetical protein
MKEKRSLLIKHTVEHHYSEILVSYVMIQKVAEAKIVLFYQT